MADTAKAKMKKLPPIVTSHSGPAKRRVLIERSVTPKPGPEQRVTRRSSLRYQLAQNRHSIH
jgi:hypothetical protein